MGNAVSVGFKKSKQRGCGVVVIRVVKFLPSGFLLFSETFETFVFLFFNNLLGMSRGSVWPRRVRMGVSPNGLVSFGKAGGNRPCHKLSHSTFLNKERPD